MGNAKQLRTAWFALVAIAWTGVVAAEPPKTDGNVAISAELLATIPAEGPLDPEQDHYSRNPGKASLNALDAATTANGVVPSIAYEAAPRWITVLGDVRDAGSYELVSPSMTAGELLARCGGPDTLSNHTLHLVREGQPWGPIATPEEALRAGDLVVVQSLDARPADGSVLLGLVGLLDSPVAVRVPDDFATINRILERANQTHLSAADVTVLVDGARGVPMEGTSRLPDCAVLVFNPDRVKQARVPALRTQRFASAADEKIQLAGQTPHVKTDEEPAAIPRQTTNASPAGHVTISAIPAESENLSPLPRVQPLGPPPLENQSSAGGPPRTADRSGAVTIGPPEPDSHIVPYPVEEFLPPVEDERMAAAPAPPVQKNEPQEPVGLPVIEPDEADVSKAPQDEWELWPIALLAMLLGGGTFYLIRRLRDEDARATLGENLRALVSRRDWRTEDEDEDDHHAFSEHETAEVPLPLAIHQRIEEQSVAAIPETNLVMSPADVLAALAANRLTFREEQVELPKALFVQGRSNAPARRRVDAGDDRPCTPHLHDDQAAVARGSRGAVSPHETESDDDILFDPAEPISGQTAARQYGTPFEQALATLRASRST